ncbi:alpha/beta hydrolase family protein [Porticoccus sp. GXU_MW_L64]
MSLSARTNWRLPLASGLCVVLLLSLTVSPVTWGQQSVAEKPAASEQNAEAKRPLEVSDMLTWNVTKAARLSPSGGWLAYIVGPEEGDSEMVVKQIDGDKEHRFSVGWAQQAGPVEYSSNSRWLAFNINPGFKESQGGKKPKGGKIALVDLNNGELTEFTDVQQFRFAGKRDPWMALHKKPASGGQQGGSGASKAGTGKSKSQPATGRDLILRQLASGTEINIGNVSEYAFDEAGERLAWIVDSKGQSGNGVQVRNLQSDVVRVLDSGKARYKKLAWKRKKNALAFLKGEKDEGYEDMLYSVVGVQKPDTKKSLISVFDPKKDDSFPEGFSISANQQPYWNDRLDTLVFGIAEVKAVEKPAADKGKGAEQPKNGARENNDTQENNAADADSKQQDKKTPATDKKKSKPAAKVAQNEKPGLVLWHWKDKRLQSQQQKEAGRDKNRTYLASYQINSKRFVRHGNEQTPLLKTTANHSWGIGYDPSKYELMASLNGKKHNDIYRINLKTGERYLALENIRHDAALSPQGRYFLYYLNGHYHTLELSTGKVRNITQGVKTSFINTESDVPQVDPPRPSIGWAKGEKWVLLSDGWDVWKVSATGGKAENLTGNGKQKQLRYTGLETYNKDRQFEGIDLADDLYFNVYGEWTKKSGIARVQAGRRGVTLLKWGDAKYAKPRKAKDADVFVYSRQTAVEFPDFYATDSRFADSRRLTHVGKNQDKFHWTAGARLVDFTTDKGVKLQAALTLPANYEPGKKYPTIVYIYEKRSQNLHDYVMPRVSGFNLSYYTSNGYAVLQPDIVYEVDNPGMSAVWAVLPAVKAAVATGIVDEDKVGLHGHSWGGYQSSFLATQSDAFAAIVTGAPLTNMISMYGLNYWNSGVSNGSIFEDRQGRFSSHYLDLPEAYSRNSPILFADKVNTPIVLLHNDKDGAVDFTQGVEYYNILRRLGKEVVMLQYVGENHGVRKLANRKDYTVRMKEFFDHQLKGKEAPDWWLDGVPHLEMDKHVEQRVTALKEQAKKLKGKKKQTAPATVE